MPTELQSCRWKVCIFILIVIHIHVTKYVSLGKLLHVDVVVVELKFLVILSYSVFFMSANMDTWCEHPLSSSQWSEPPPLQKKQSSVHYSGNKTSIFKSPLQAGCGQLRGIPTRDIVLFYKPLLNTGNFIMAHYCFAHEVSSITYTNFYRTCHLPRVALTAPFNNTWNLKFKSPTTIAFFAAVNHNLKKCTSAINRP